MIPKRFRRLAPRAPMLPLAAIALAVLGACGRPAPASAPYPTTVRVEPTAGGAADAPANAALPPLPVAQVEQTNGARRIENLEVVEQDLRLVIRSLAESFGLDYQLDPAVSGRVTARLNDVTLEEALEAVIVPQGLTYTLQGRVLRVTPSRLQTRIFTLDYVSLSRTGIGTTIVQRRLGPTGGQSGGTGLGATGASGFSGAFGAGGGDVIQSVTVADLWEEIRISLEGLVFDSTSAQPAFGATNPAAGAVGGVGAGGQGGGLGAPIAMRGAFSRVDPDGRRLIINPISGTILIAAPPEKLEEVAAFLSAIEGSVQRQVLIEAKIVEVALNQSSQFGIDWSVVQRVGSVNLQIGGGAGGAQFTIADQGLDPDGRVNVVLRALASQGEVNMLSAPRVSVLNNQRAVINVARDEVFFSVTRQPVIGPTGATIGFNTEIVPQQIAVGIVLDVLAQIAPDNVITMNVRPVITDVVDVRSVELEDGTQASAPIIDRRETDTMVRVRGGETVVIGGLMQNAQVTNRTGVPVLKDLPGIGRLFGGSEVTTEKRELVIFITPRIVAGQPPASD